jgi:putative ABC transport system permease protein
VRYLVRTEPGRREELMPVVEEALARSNTERIIRAPESMAETDKDSYALDSGLDRILGVIMVLLIAITTLGIVGLASFSLRRRTKQIGTRRVLGASKGDILRYFLVSNFLNTSMGAVLGAVMTVGFNIALVDFLGFPKIDVAVRAAGDGSARAGGTDGGT